jgi:cytochrome oxidase Cu insertion factor (SCO1/SenC/PrrC family)
LTNQHGDKVSLADYRGKVVVLTLLDPICTDICPVYANHYRPAYNALEEEERKEVIFLAFNANDRMTSVEGVRSATRRWGLDGIPTFHFVTGDAGELTAVWDDYNLEASGDPKSGKPGELQHSPAVFLIDQSGQLRRFLSTNFEGAPPLSALIVERARALLNKGWW